MRQYSCAFPSKSLWKGAPILGDRYFAPRLRQVKSAIPASLYSASIAFTDSTKGTFVSTLTIRNLEPAIKDKLRQAAAAQGRSMEEHVRVILRSVLTQPTPAAGVGSRIHARFAALGGAELALPDRGDQPRAAVFAGDAES
jgi:plasmid stability protein